LELKWAIGLVWRLYGLVIFLSFDKCQGMPATLMTEIKRTIAVVDSSLFGNDWIDSRKAL